MTDNKREKQEQAPDVVLTLETIALAEEALELFEWPLRKADHRDAKVPFARKTVEQVKSKLAVMRSSASLPHLIGFDYNEKIILIHALRLYCMYLLSFPQDAPHIELILTCLRLAALFEANNARAEYRHPDNDVK